MKIKMSQALATRKIYNSIQSEVLPVKLAYKFSKLFASFNQVQDFYDTELNKLVEIYGQKDDNGNFVPSNDGGIKIRPEVTVEANTKVKELDQLEVDCADIKFEIDELKDLHISLSEFNQLMPFIKDEDEKTEQ